MVLKLFFEKGSYRELEHCMTKLDCYSVLLDMKQAYDRLFECTAEVIEIQIQFMENYPDCKCTAEIAIARGSKACKRFDRKCAQ